MNVLHQVMTATPLDNSRIRVSFENGMGGVFDCAPYLKDKYWESLANPTFFSEITIDGVSEKVDRKALREELSELEAEFDLVVLDVPPINIVSDPLALSNLTAGGIFVVRQGYSEHREVKKALMQAELTGLNLLGFVFYGENLHDEGYYRKGYYYNSYYKAGYGQNSRQDKKKKDNKRIRNARSQKPQGVL